MLNLTIKAGEYFTIGEDIKVVILGGAYNHCRIMIDAPKNYNIVRGKVLEKQADTAEQKKHFQNTILNQKTKSKAYSSLLISDSNSRLT